MKHIFRSLALALLLLVLAQTSVFSQQSYQLPADGKDFWVGYMYPSYNKVGNASTDGFYGAFVLVSSYTDNFIQLSYFDKQSGVEKPSGRYKILARTGIQIPLSIQEVRNQDSGDVAEFNACHITADHPINVEFFSSGACSGGSFLPITTAGLGKRYVIASYNDNPDGELGLLGGYLGPRELEKSLGFFEIIAPFDGTSVTIIPNSTTLGGDHSGFHSGKHPSFPKESPYVVSLRRGQTYLVKSSGSSPDDDISGSIVESNLPVAVIAGHENASIGGVSGRGLEGRDFMVEQMYPYDMWDSVGYVMIPLADSQPADPNSYDGVGENYRVYCWDSVGATVNMTDGCIGSGIILQAGRLAQPPPERFGVTCPVDFQSSNGKKFTVMMYDQRNFATTAPYPAPSMVTVIPMSRWRTSFLWYVPTNKFETLQAYYVNIIAPTPDFDKGIVGSYNGGAIKPIKSVISLTKQWKILPNHPGFSGVQFKLSPGSYYATGPHPFMVYNFGFRALDPNFDLGDFDGDDFFFSYGLPVGVSLGTGISHMRITVDTFCSYWNICAHDSTFGLANRGIKSVTLLYDPTQDIIKTDPKPAKVFYNTRLDDSLDPGYPSFNTNEINFTGEDSDVCFKVLVNKATDSAYAPVFIVDDQGNAIIVDLYYKPPFVELTPDSGRFLHIPIGKDTCQSFLFYNKGLIVVSNDTIIKFNNVTNKNDTIVNKNVKHHVGKTFTVSSDKLKRGNPTFTVSKTVPSLPADIKPGDSLWITACFSAKDSLTQRDTIMLVNDCFTSPIDLVGKGAIPLIVAGNRDFGNVIVDSTKCDTVSVRNVGDADFTLTTDWVLHNTKNFNFIDSTRLPIIMKPGQVVYLTFCYTPHAEQLDTTVQNWGTTEQDPYKHAIKDSSLLRGRGVKSGFVWDRTVQEQSVTCDDSTVVRVYLFNNATGLGSPNAHVDSVIVVPAPDTDPGEFHMLRNQLGYTPLGNYDLKPGDSTWVDVVFKANLAKPWPQKYADRHMQLIAVNRKLEQDQIIDFTGHVLYAAAQPNPTILNYGNVALNLTNTRSFRLCDTGTAPLVIESITKITYPITNVLDQNGKAISPGDSIQPGQCIDVQIEAALSNYIDTSVVLNFNFRTSCPQPVQETLQIAASFVNPSNTGHPFEPTYLNCRNLVDSIQARNLGTTDLTLEKIELINQNPPSPPAAQQFSFADGTQTLLVGKVYHRGQRFNYLVKFNPTIEGPVSDSVLCTWDSLDVLTGKVVKKLYSGNILTGIGKLERNEVSPLQANPSAVYNTTTGSVIDVPINLLSTLPAGAQAFGITFQVTYRQDLLDYIPNPNYDGSLTPVPGTPTVVPDGNGNETVTYSLSSPVPITTLKPIVTMHFRLMVAKDYYSTIAVSNAVFWGTGPTDTLCYVINKVDTALFDPNPLCGDSTLRGYLNKNLPTKIIGITPNPATESGTPIVTYEVMGAKVPLTIELFNALGDRIRIVEKGVPHEIGQYNLPIGAKNLPSGMYVIRITSPTSVESSQFVIQK